MKKIIRFFKEFFFGQHHKCKQKLWLPNGIHTDDVVSLQLNRSESFRKVLFPRISSSGILAAAAVNSSSSSGRSSSFADILKFWTVSSGFLMDGDGDGDGALFFDNVISIGDCWRLNGDWCRSWALNTKRFEFLYAFACFKSCSCPLNSISNVGFMRKYADDSGFGECVPASFGGKIPRKLIDWKIFQINTFDNSYPSNEKTYRNASSANIVWWCKILSILDGSASKRLKPKADNGYPNGGVGGALKLLVKPAAMCRVGGKFEWSSSDICVCA